MPDVYDIGDTVEVYTDEPFTNNNGAFDPAEVKFHIKSPDGTVTSYTYNTDPEVVRDAAGEYHVIVYVDTSGVWRYRIEGFDAQGRGISAEEGRFEVLTQRVTP